MKKKMKKFVLTTAMITSLAILPTGAFADTSYNTELAGGQSKTIATEAIWADSHIIGAQSPVYSGGLCGVRYAVKNSAGAEVDFGQRYGIGEFRIDFESNNGFGGNFSITAKNIYVDLVNKVKIWGTWFD